MSVVEGHQTLLARACPDCGCTWVGFRWFREQCKPRVEKKTPEEKSGRQGRQRYSGFGDILILEKFTQVHSLQGC